MNKRDLNVHEDASTLDVADRGRGGRRKYPVVTTEKPRAAPLPPLPGLREIAPAQAERGGAGEGGAWAVAGTEPKSERGGLDGGGRPTGRGLEESGSGFCPSFSAQQGMILFFRNFLSFTFLIFFKVFVIFSSLGVPCWARASPYSGFSCCGTRVLGAWLQYLQHSGSSSSVAHGFSCSAASEILLHQESPFGVP